MSGVLHVPPPPKLIPDLQKSIERAMADVPPGKFALVADVDQAGGNAAIAYKSKGGDVTVESWIAKKWKQEGIEFGARVELVLGGDD